MSQTCLPRWHHHLFQVPFGQGAERHCNFKVLWDTFQVRVVIADCGCRHHSGSLGNDERGIYIFKSILHLFNHANFFDAKQTASFHEKWWKRMQSENPPQNKKNRWNPRDFNGLGSLNLMARIKCAWKLLFSIIRINYMVYSNLK